MNFFLQSYNKMQEADTVIFSNLRRNLIRSIFWTVRNIPNYESSVFEKIRLDSIEKFLF